MLLDFKACKEAAIDKPQTRKGDAETQDKSQTRGVVGKPQTPKGDAA